MLKNISQIVKLCDYVTVSTEPLAEYIRARFNPNVIVIPNMLPNMFGYIKKPTDKIRIGFVGSDTHKGDFSFELCQALRRIKSEFNNVELVFMGYNPIPGADVEFHKFVPLDEYFSKLFRLNLHIGICPLRDDTFNRSKSNIKFLEYSACSMATIASDVYPFSETIEEDRTGLLVRKEKEWYGKLKELIICEGVRKSISENAYNYVKSHFTYKQNGIKITNAYNKMLEDMYGSN
jgi:glycosyltransferase involved in cell wall biosynthesis